TSFCRADRTRPGGGAIDRVPTWRVHGDNASPAGPGTGGFGTAAAEGTIMAEATIDHGLAGTGSIPGTGSISGTGPIRADLGQILARSAARFGAKPALVAAGRSFTYRQLHDLCDRAVGGLRELGVRPGDRVSLYSPNRWEWVVAYHAALRAGAVVNPINVMLTAEEVAFVLKDCGAAAIFTSGEKAEVIAGLTRVSGSVPTLRRVISFDPA